MLIGKIVDNDFAIFIAQLDQDWRRKLVAEKVRRLAQCSARKNFQKVRRVRRVVLFQDFENFSRTPRLNRVFQFGNALRLDLILCEFRLYGQFRIAIHLHEILRRTC